MSETDAGLLRDLGRGTSIVSIRAAMGWSPSAFAEWWQQQCALRVPAVDGRVPAPTAAATSIVRDHRGIPHCFAEDDADLFVGYGYAMAQDRLFQMDLRRRKGHGRVAALLGPDGIADDRVAHTIGLPDLAAAELDRLDAPTRRLFERFADGVEAAVASMTGRLPIEYALLGATWEPWTALDVIACAMSWRWQFTGRPHVYAGPELMKRALGDAGLVDLILATDREADTPSLPPDAPYPAPPRGLDTTPRQVTDEPMFTDTVPGSNNWVMSGAWSSSGSPLLAADPHMPYEWSSAFYEVGLHGGSFDAVGAGLIGLPGFVMGRNRTTAWGFTNNICSLRDLYAERRDDGRKDTFLVDGQPTRARRRTVSFEVRDAAAESFDVVETERGPIIDALLPPLAAGTGPVSMRWLGSEPCTWPRALLDLTRAASVEGALAAVRGWLVPTFGLVLADVSGAIGFIDTGRIPLRSVPSRTYRDASDSDDRWIGLIPDEAMPQAVDPARGWLASANNRPAAEDYPYPLSGTWAEGYRVRRIGRLIEALQPRSADRATLTTMHGDVVTPRAAELMDDLLGLLSGGVDERQRSAIELLRRWDGRTTPDSAAAAIFEVFFHRFAQALMAVRIPDRDLADYLGNWALGLASHVLKTDDGRWLGSAERARLVTETFSATLDEIADALGPEPTTWRWGALHRLTLKHVLSDRGDLGELLDVPVGEVGGSLVTLSNSGFDATRPEGAGPDGNLAWRPTSGAGYRLEVDLGEQPPAAWSITLESQSGVPEDPHYRDQVDDFLHGRTHRLALDRDEVDLDAAHELQLVPSGQDTTARQAEGGVAR